MKNLKTNEINKIRGGMCNCVVSSNREDNGGISSVGLVTYANVCKDIVSNISSWRDPAFNVHWNVQYVGCFPQTEEGVRDYFRGKY